MVGASGRAAHSLVCRHEARRDRRHGHGRHPSVRRRAARAGRRAARRRHRSAGPSAGLYLRGQRRGVAPSTPVAAGSAAGIPAGAASSRRRHRGDLRPGESAPRARRVRRQVGAGATRISPAGVARPARRHRRYMARTDGAVRGAAGRPAAAHMVTPGRRREYVAPRHPARSRRRRVRPTRRDRAVQRRHDRQWPIAPTSPGVTESRQAQRVVCRQSGLRKGAHRRRAPGRTHRS